MALTKSGFLRGRETKNGLAGYLDGHIKGWGTATVASGATSVTTAYTGIAAGDLVIASVLTKGTNACYVVGVTIVAATSFAIAVSADPGTGGAVISYVIIRP